MWKVVLVGGAEGKCWAEISKPVYWRSEFVGEDWESVLGRSSSQMLE
jgi:hypothetical protein